MSSSINRLESLFGEDRPQLDVTAGYEDRSPDGIATEFLAGLDETEREAIQSLAERGLNDPLLFPAHIHALLDELDGYDPNRTKGSSYYATEELRRIELWFSVLHNRGAVPYLRTEFDTKTSVDASITFWDILEIDQVNKLEELMHPPFELINRHIQDEANPSSNFMKTMYAVLAQSMLRDKAQQ